VEPLVEYTPENVLRLAASLEQASEHPLASAFVRAAVERNLPLAEVRDFQSITGKGVVGTVEGHRVAVGTASLLEQQGIITEPFRPRIQELAGEGQTVVLVAIDGR